MCIEWSDKITVNHGVQQIIALGPPNIVLYINNFSEKQEFEIDIVQFAPDTSTNCKFESNEYVLLKHKKFSEQTDKYMTENHLTKNAERQKCYSLRITLIRIQRLLLKAKLSHQLTLFVILKYKLVQT